MRKKTLKRQRKQRGSGPETEIQKKIREELERILLIFTLCPDIRERYTQNHMSDFTSEGARLIYALRDIYSSKWMKGSKKAIERNELVARIIKLIINEDIYEQQQGFGNPVREGFGYNIRAPIIIPHGGVSTLALAAPSFFAHHVAKCVGAACHALRRISDEDAFTNLCDITTNINTENTERIKTFNDIKIWFDDKRKFIINDVYDDYENDVNSRTFARRISNDIIGLNNIVETRYENYINGLIHSIQNFNLLFFISNFFYDTLYYSISNTEDKFKYNGEYIDNLFKSLNNQVSYFEIKYKKNQDSTNVSIANPVSNNTEIDELNQKLSAGGTRKKRKNNKLRQSQIRKNIKPSQHKIT